ncbi:winged helix-turn-helix domain-containing protein [Pedomonas sp.]|uniref:winged helix-turn-helix domain-containing protein n=1 Tax=Pedomonas sp. TaxID=2976421 RepID=UPI0039C95F12
MVGPLKLKAQLFCGDEIAMGPGKADLLDAIDTHGSISAAGRALGMSYRRTWLLVDTMNRCWREPLVDTAAGGPHGGGARLSPLGRQVLQRFRTIERKMAEAVEGDPLLMLLEPMRAAPKTSRQD